MRVGWAVGLVACGVVDVRGDVTVRGELDPYYRANETWETLASSWYGARDWDAASSEAYADWYAQDRCAFAVPCASRGVLARAGCGGREDVGPGS